MGGQDGSERRMEVFFWGGGGWVGGVQGACESRMEVFWKIQKKKLGGGGGLVWGQDGCERRIEVFVKIQKKKFAGGGGGGGGGVGGVGGSGWM